MQALYRTDAPASITASLPQDPAAPAGAAERARTAVFAAALPVVQNGQHQPGSAHTQSRGRAFQGEAKRFFPPLRLLRSAPGAVARVRFEVACG